MSRPPFVLTLPEKRNTACVFASPHSGRDYPWSFIQDAKLDEMTIRSSEDAFVDLLFASAPEQGAPLLSTVVPRAYVDLNRASDELDPALIKGIKQTGHNPRISSGLGVIPRVVSGGRQIRSGKINLSEAQRRLDLYYHPYHKKLAELLADNRREFGFALLFDCHSMPHKALDSNSYAYDQHPEIVLGDRFGATADQDLIEAAEDAFVSAGLRVSRNLPFAGAHVTQYYGRPAIGNHAIQIEIDRSLYLDEEHIRPNENFVAFVKLMRGVIENLTDLGRQSLSQAAE